MLDDTDLELALPRHLLHDILGADETGNWTAGVLTDLGGNPTEATRGGPLPGAMGPYPTSFGADDLFGDVTFWPSTAPGAYPNTGVSHMPGPSGAAQPSAAAPHPRSAEFLGDVDERMAEQSSEEESSDEEQPLVAPTNVKTIDMATLVRPYVKLPRYPRGAAVPGPSNAGAAHQRAVLAPAGTLSSQARRQVPVARPASAFTYHDVLRKFETLAPGISDSELNKFYGEFYFGSEDVRKKLLAFWLALNEYNVQNLIDLRWVPERAAGKIHSKTLANDLTLGRNYFIQLRHQYKNKKSGEAPLMYMVLERFSLAAGLTPPGPSSAGAARQVASYRLAGPSASGTVPQAPVVPSPAKINYSDVIEAARKRRDSIPKAQLDNFFGRSSTYSAHFRNILALILVLDENGVDTAKELSGFPTNKWGFADATKLASALNVSLATLRGYIQRSGPDAPRWLRDIVGRLCLGGAAKRIKPCVSESD